ncbi:MAG: helix-turn-helix transcriptional regulator [Defluviitaleaceae bacterium]|nr:helix-turn-helix transcriptional regulator [Defluviitaleaceae bacterium]
MKDELFNEFFSLGGNHKSLPKVRAFQNKLSKYIEKLEKEDLQLIHLLIMSQIELEALNDRNFDKISETAKPIIEKLTYKSISKWNLYDIRLTQYAVGYTFNFEEAEILFSQAFAALNKYLKHELYVKIKLAIHMNILIRLLRAYFFEIDIRSHISRFQKLEKLFIENVSSALAICESSAEEFKIYETAILIRKHIFEREFEEIDPLLEELKDMNRDIYKAVKDEVKFYFSSAGSSITKNQFAILVGSNVRQLRELKGISLEEVAYVLDCTVSHLSSLESGDKSFYGYQLFKIAHKLDVSIEEIYKGIKEQDKLMLEEDQEFEKLKAKSKGLKKEGLLLLQDFADNLHKFKIQFKKTGY